MKTPRQIAKNTRELWCDYYRDGDKINDDIIDEIISDVEQYGKYQYNLALSDAAKNVKICMLRGGFDWIDLDSILKKSKRMKTLKLINEIIQNALLVIAGGCVMAGYFYVLCLIFD